MLPHLYRSQRSRYWRKERTFEPLFEDDLLPGLRRRLGSRTGAAQDIIFATYSASGRGSIRVSPAPEGKVHIALRLIFAAGPTCKLTKAGCWQTDLIEITAQGLEADQPCKLEASFPKGAILLKDVGLRCAPVYCGTRGKTRWSQPFRAARASLTLAK